MHQLFMQIIAHSFPKTLRIKYLGTDRIVIARVKHPWGGGSTATPLIESVGLAQGDALVGASDDPLRDPRGVVGVVGVGPEIDLFVPRVPRRVLGELLRGRAAGEFGPDQLHELGYDRVGVLDLDLQETPLDVLDVEVRGVHADLSNPVDHAQHVFSCLGDLLGSEGLLDLPDDGVGHVDRVPPLLGRDDSRDDEERTEDVDCRIHGNLQIVGCLQTFRTFYRLKN